MFPQSLVRIIGETVLGGVLVALVVENPRVDSPQCGTEDNYREINW